MHSAPLVCGEIEFFNTHFSVFLRYFDIKFEPHPTGRHSQLGVVERKNAVVRILIQRLLKNAAHFSLTRGGTTGREEVLYHAVYLSNILYGSKTLRSFEMTRGYTPALFGLL